jgi:hypothetical protein
MVTLRKGKMEGYLFFLDRGLRVVIFPLGKNEGVSNGWLEYVKAAQENRHDMP